MLKLIKNYQPTASCTASHFKATFAILASTQAKNRKNNKAFDGQIYLYRIQLPWITITWMNGTERIGWDQWCSGLGSGFASGRGGTSINVPLTFAWTADKNCHNKQYNHDDNDNNKNNSGSEEDTWRDLEGRPSSGWDSENRSW